MSLLAQTLNLPGSKGGSTIITGPVNRFNDIGGLIGQAIPFVFAFAGIGLLLMIIAAGMTLLTSAGDPKKMESGKQRLTYAIVGFLVIFAAFWIVQILGKILGFAEIGSIFGQ